MRSIKILGVVFAAMLIAAAFAGATSASATVLCKENVSPCTGASAYPSGTAIEASLKTGTKVEIEGSLTITCSGSTLTGKTTAEKGVSVPLEITGFTLSGCTSGCQTAEAQNLPYSGKISRTSGGNGSASVSSGGKGNPSVYFTGCTFFKVNCIYGAGQLDFTLQGGNPAVLTAKSTKLTRESGSSGLCAETVTLSALSYEITSPKPLYASATGVEVTVFCKENASLCPSASAYSSGTTISSEATLPEMGTLFGNNVRCNSSAMSIKTTAEGGNPLSVEVPSWTFSSCTGACQTVEGVTPLSLSVEATSGGNGTMQGGIELKLSNCFGAGATCRYGHNKASFSITGGATNPKVTFGPITLAQQAGSSAICPEVWNVVNAQYNVSSPLPLWVTKVEI